MVQLSDDLLERLDAEAGRRRVSRSALIRTILVEYLLEHGEAAVGRRIVEGYRSIPPATPDAWGELDLLGDAGTVEVLVRLDAEEKTSGCGPW